MEKKKNWCVFYIVKHHEMLLEMNTQWNIFKTKEYFPIFHLIYAISKCSVFHG